MLATLIHKVVPDLVERACPSIKYRINSEILGRLPLSGGMQELQDQILQDTAIAEVQSWQQADGWLAWDFHGPKSIEAGIRILCEKGVDRGQPILARALHALERHTDRLDRGIGKVGRVLDEQGFGGSLMIQATVFAYAGMEDRPFMEQQIQAALDGFRAVAHVNSLDELTEGHKGKLVFRPGSHWPGIYHLRLLAFTHTWRTAENREMVADAVRKLVDLSPLPDIYVRHGSQLMAPASFAMHDFNPDMCSLNDAQWMMWFHRMECLARLGVVHLVPQLQAQVRTLAAMLVDEGGSFVRKLQHSYFTRWGSYTGLMLERDWRTAERRANDLTFRSLLIMHFTEHSFQADKRDTIKCVSSPAVDALR